MKTNRVFKTKSTFLIGYLDTIEVSHNQRIFQSTQEEQVDYLLGETMMIGIMMEIRQEHPQQVQRIRKLLIILQIQVIWMVVNKQLIQHLVDRLEKQQNQQVKRRRR